MLRETRRLLINRYMSVMGPKLHAVAERVLEKLKKEKGGCPWIVVIGSLLMRIA